MVIAQVRCENVHHSKVSDRLEHSISNYAQAVSTSMAVNSSVIAPHATTAQELMAANVKSVRNVSPRQNISRTCQRMEMTGWKSRHIKVVPTVCRSRACRTQHWHCPFGITIRTAELIRHNQQLQRRISELQRETGMCFKSKPVLNNHFEDVSAPDSECVSNTSRSPSPVDVLPTDSVDSS